MSLEHRDENKSCSACPNDQHKHLTYDMWKVTCDMGRHGTAWQTITFELTHENKSCSEHSNIQTFFIFVGSYVPTETDFVYKFARIISLIDAWIIQLIYARTVWTMNTDARIIWTQEHKLFEIVWSNCVYDIGFNL